MKRLLILLVILLSCNAVFADVQDVDNEYYINLIKAQSFPYNANGFFASAAKGDIVLVDSFIKSGMDINKTFLGTTPLSIAVFKNENEVVELLCENGADTNLANPDGTPLFFAVYRKNLNNVTTLLEHGADVNLLSKNKKVIDIAVKSKQTEIIELLLNSSAKVDEKTLKYAKKTKDEYIINLIQSALSSN